MRFKDKVILVTGGGRGLGRSMAMAFAEEGGKLVLTARTQAQLDSVAAEIKEKGGEAIGVSTDVSNPEQVKAAVDKAVQTFGTIDVLVNNAGITDTGMIVKMKEEQWDRVMDINLKGMFNCLQAVGPIFIERAKSNPEARSNGKVINITSTAGLRGTIGQVNYSAAKAGAVGLTMAAAREWARFRINVNAVAFGVIETEMTDVIRADPKFYAAYLKQIPLGRYGDPDEVMPAVLFFSSNESDYITGQTLSVCGGFHIGS